MNAKITPFEREQDEGWRDAHKGFTIEQKKDKTKKSRQRIENALFMVDHYLNDLRESIQQWGEEVKND